MQTVTHINFAYTLVTKSLENCKSMASIFTYINVQIQIFQCKNASVKLQKLYMKT